MRLRSVFQGAQAQQRHSGSSYQKSQSVAATQQTWKQGWLGAAQIQSVCQAAAVKVGIESSVGTLTLDSCRLTLSTTDIRVCYLCLQGLRCLHPHGRAARQTLHAILETVKTRCTEERAPRPPRARTGDLWLAVAIAKVSAQSCALHRT